MAKRGALLTNERLKLYKKPSTWILMGIIVALTLMGLVLSQLFKNVNNTYVAPIWQEQYNSYIGDLSIQLKDNPDQKGLKSDMDAMKYLLEKGIEPQDWRSDVVFEYYRLQEGSSGESYGKTPVPQPDIENLDRQQAEERMKKLLPLIEKNDWKGYIQLKIDDLKSGYTVSESAQEKQVDIDIYNLYLEWNIIPVSPYQYYYNSSGRESDQASWKNAQIQTVRTNKLALLRGENDNGELLNSTQRAACQSNIDVALKRLSTNTPPIAADSFLGLLESAVSSLDMISILLIVFAGGIFATEFSTGTIKLLMITPHRRQRIFWAKARLMLETTLIAYAAVFVLAFLFSGLFTGFHNIGAMQVVSLFGVIWHMPYLLYIVLCSLILLVPVITYGAMALMISAVSRKSAVSIALTLIIMFGSEIVVSILAMISSRMVVPGLKFLLFSNTTLTSYLPTAGSQMYSGSIMTVDGTMTLGFSLAVLLLYLGCFLWIARDSFCRRDIK